ncbi:hypothetical protein E0W68_13055 [Flavobacterium salilacus subsp. salilacus]|uniref:hypothetical protein n=1 Tax=Flavobacterium TaxID=237 RepID=UPI001074F4C2|nr:MULTISPECIES: hypothetical protein [Flavobacterium]KAF2515458.1 hypothetical protein E0W68_13055 [Flavobacterium salilacus subsp. salilacus]MBE1615856.1 hypothetical protein [Flavobacterium sp. SaA2.13]
MKNFICSFVLFLGFVTLSSAQSSFPPEEEARIETALLEEYSPSFPIDSPDYETHKADCKKIATYVYLVLRNNGYSVHDSGFFARFVYDACVEIFNGGSK